MALNYVTLILDVADGTGAPVNRGLATLVPSVQLKDVADDLLVVQAPVGGQFAGFTFPQVRLLATDNANLAPSGWEWVISFIVVPGNPVSFSFFLPYSAGATQYLSSVAPASGSIPIVLSDLDGGSAAGGGFPVGAIDGGAA